MIAEVRGKLLTQQPIDLCSAPLEVKWVQLDGNDDHAKLLRASCEKSPIEDGGVLIIGESINADSRYRIASAVQGAVTVEAVDLRDLTGFANRFTLGNNTALAEITAFAQSLMTNVGANDLVTRVQSLLRETAIKEPSNVERTAIKFVQNPTFSHAVELLVEINKQPGVRIYRPAVLRACIKAMQLCQTNNSLTFFEAAVQIREHNRALGRPLPQRAVGSTLLLKGLEADVAVILNADTLDSRNLYVAMTRGCRKLVICSHSNILNPRSMEGSRGLAA